MNTISTVSSISFNTPTFFEMKIKELSQLGKGQVIDWCHWVEIQQLLYLIGNHIFLSCLYGRLRMEDIDEILPKFHE